MGSLWSLARRELGAGGMGGVDSGLEIAAAVGFGQDVYIRAQVAAGGSLIAMESGEGLDDLRAAAMAVHVAEAADVHKNVEAQSGPGVKSAECLVVAATVTQTQLNDFGHARLGQRTHLVANLPVRVVRG